MDRTPAGHAEESPYRTSAKPVDARPPARAADVFDGVSAGAAFFAVALAVLGFFAPGNQEAFALWIGSGIWALHVFAAQAMRP